MADKTNLFHLYFCSLDVPTVNGRQKNVSAVFYHLRSPYNANIVHFKFRSSPIFLTLTLLKAVSLLSCYNHVVGLHLPFNPRNAGEGVRISLPPGSPEKLQNRCRYRHKIWCPLTYINLTSNDQISSKSAGFFFNWRFCGVTSRQFDQNRLNVKTFAKNRILRQTAQKDTKNPETYVLKLGERNISSKFC